MRDLKNKITNTIDDVCGGMNIEFNIAVGVSLVIEFVVLKLLNII